jgi:hypothetical protein
MLWHRLGAWVFCQTNPRFSCLLLDLGWEWDGVKLWHPNLAKELA